jgi:DNA-binding beta-propeller fold protein YncE
MRSFGSRDRILGTVSAVSLGTVLLAGLPSVRVAAASTGSPGYTVKTIALAGGAGGVAVDPATGMAYVGTLGNVDVIDEQTATIVKTIGIGGDYEADEAVDASTNTIYTASYGAVVVVDAASDTVTARISLPQQVVSVALDPDTGVLYAAYDNGQDVAAIDVATDKVTTTASIGPGLSAFFLAVDPATDTLYASGPATGNNGAVSALDGTTLDVTHTVPISASSVGNSFPDIDVDPATDQVFVADASGVHVIDGSTFQVTQLSATPACGIVVNSAAGTVIVGELLASEVDVLDASTGKVLMSAPAPSNGLNGHAIALDPDSGIVYATSPVSTGVVSQLTPGISPGFGTGGSAVFTTGNSGTFTVTTTGSPVPAVSLAGKLPPGVKFTPGQQGDAVLSGTPAAGSGGTYRLTLDASNGVTPAATEAFTLTVRQAPSIVSPGRAEFRYGRRTRFVVRSKGFPFPTFRVVGRLPRGFTFRSSGAGAATLTASPVRWEIGRRFTIRITASNGVGRPATDKLTIEVLPARSRS